MPKHSLVAALASALLLALGTAMAQSGTNATLTADIQYLGGDEGIPAGAPGRFRVTVTNHGPDASTNTHAWIAWFRTPVIGDLIGYDYGMRPSQGMCSRSYTPDPDCYLGMIPANRSITIDVDGQTEPNRLGWYTLRVWVASDQASKTMLAEFSKGTSVTVLETGGGSVGVALLLALLVANRRSLRPNGQRNMLHKS